MAGLAAEYGKDKITMIDATYLKAHRTETHLGVKKGAWTPARLDQGRYEHKAARYLRQQKTPTQLVYDRRTGQRTGIVEQPAKCRVAAWDRGCEANWFRDALKDRAIHAGIPGPKQ